MKTAKLKNKKSIKGKKKLSRKNTDLVARLCSALQKDIWPNERDIMERPDRLKYVRKLIPMDGCVFCHARSMSLGESSLCLYKNKHAMVILNKYPYNTGHLMVLPTRHTGDLTNLSDEEYFAVSELLRQSVAIIKKVYNVSGLNVGLNMGAVAGAGIPDHMHWHLVPRWTGDTNFFPLIAETKAVPETLQQTYLRYRPHFLKLKDKS